MINRLKATNNNKAPDYGPVALLNFANIILNPHHNFCLLRINRLRLIFRL